MLQHTAALPERPQTLLPPDSASQWVRVGMRGVWAAGGHTSTRLLQAGRPLGEPKRMQEQACGHSEAELQGCRGEAALVVAKTSVCMNDPSVLHITGQVI